LEREWVGVGMAKIERFEDVEAWKKARELSRAIYSFTASGAISKDFGLRDQMRRAAVSIMSNIAEGFERNGNREFIQFLTFAKGSTGELKAQLYVALDARMIDQENFTSFYQQADEIGRVIGGLIKYLLQSKLKGSKFK
jgi:four helix bundle protein